MLINAQRPEELRIAILDGTALEGYQVEVAAAGLSRGNIYRGVIANVQPSLNAAFIDYGGERHGFLPIQDVVPQAYYREPAGSHPRIEEVLERGKPIVVQVAKDAVGDKGSSLTTNLSLAGRYLVLTPFDDTRGVSRKVEDDDVRKKLRQTAAKLELPDGCGIIVRTNALDQTKLTLSRDLAALLRLWKRVQTEARRGQGTRLLYSDQDLIVQALRDHLDASIEEVLVDDDETFERAAAYMQAFMPRGRTRLVRYAERLPLFSRFDVEPQLERISERRVPLPSGGSIVIDPTEALTAIDVNSGRSTRAASQEETAVHTNVEAAQEVARQLRLRDIGGLVVVDFIDMRASKNQRKVEKALRDAMKEDKARTSIGRISGNGLLEINRQRIRQPLALRTHRPCPTCGGSGSIASPEMVSLGILRRIEARAATGKVEAVRVALHPELADALQNSRRQELAAMERELEIRIEIMATPGLHRAEEKVDWTHRDKPKPLPPPKAKQRVLNPADLAPLDEEEEEEEPAPAARGTAATVAAGEEGEAGGRKRKRRRGGKKRKKGGAEAGVPPGEHPLEGAEVWLETGEPWDKAGAGEHREGPDEIERWAQAVTARVRGGAAAGSREEPVEAAGGLEAEAGVGEGHPEGAAEPPGAAAEPRPGGREPRRRPRRRGGRGAGGAADAREAVPAGLTGAGPAGEPEAEGEGEPEGEPGHAADEPDGNVLNGGAEGKRKRRRGRRRRKRGGGEPGVAAEGEAGAADAGEEHFAEQHPTDPE